MKQCSTCGQIKPLDSFGNSSSSKDGKKNKCSECKKQEYLDNREKRIEQSREYYRLNKDRCIESSKKYREKNLKWYQNNNRVYYQKNMERMKENSKASFYRRIESDIGFRILQRLRKRMWDATSGRVKSARTAELVGCSHDVLVSHIENQFTDGMTWENYGKWHLDHIIPCASFDLSKPKEQKKCFHYTNLQPLWAVDNIRKSDKLL